MKTILLNTAALIVITLVVSYAILGGDLFAFWGWVFGTLFSWIF